MLPSFQHYTRCRASVWIKREKTVSLSFVMAENREEIQLLIDGCLRNDRLSQEKVYKKYFGKMIALCMRHTADRDIAVEIVNAGFLRVFQKIEQYAWKGSFEGWIRRIMVHAVATYYRRNSRYREHITVEVEEDSGVTLDNGLNELYAEDLQLMIQKLPETPRLVFNMFCIEGYKHSDIAEMLNISEGTSRWYLSEARNQLKEMIKYHYEECSYE